MRTLLLLLISGFMAFAQAPSPAPDTTIQDLLKEVRALRLALERTNQIGPRIQIALARMQLQEERVRTATRQLQDIRDRIAGLESHRTELAENVKQLEAFQVQVVDPQERRRVDAQFNESKADMERTTTLLTQLRAREGEAQSNLTAEQARWSELDDLLRKIERELEARQ